MRYQSTLLALSLVASTMTGCAALNTLTSPAKPNVAQVEAPPEGSEGIAKVEVIFEPEKGRPERMERSLTGATTVQQLLVQSGGIKKYRRIEVEVHRQRPNGEGYFTIPCEYSRETRQINPANDIALMQGDRVVIKEDKSTVVDDIMRAAGGSLGKRFTTGGKHKEGPKFRVEG